MSQEKPHLEVVGEDAPADTAPATPEVAPAAPTGRRRPRIVTGLLVVLLLSALVAVAVQTRRVDQLGVRVERLTAELATSEARIVAHERHLVDVNNSVAALRAGLAELDEVLAQQPPRRPPR